MLIRVRRLHPWIAVRAALITAVFSLVTTGCTTPQVSQKSPTTPEPPDSGIQAWNPFLVSEPGGRLYVTYYGAAGAKKHTLFFTRSLDGGTTWLAEPVQLDSVESLRQRFGFHRLEVDRDGGVIVTWEIERKEGQYWRPMDVRLRRSSDRGDTWSSEIYAWKFTGGTNYPIARTGADGASYLLWAEQRESDPPALFLQRAAPGTHAWLKRPFVIPSPDRAGSGDTRRKRASSLGAVWPILASDQPGRLFVTWQQETPGGGDIYFSRSLDGGATWSDGPIRLNARPPDGYTARIPAIAPDGAGGVYVVWEDFRHDAIDLYFNRSLDGGATWLNQDLWLTSDRPRGATSSGPQLSADRSGRLYLIWQDGRQVPFSVYFNRSLDRGNTWVPHPIRLDHHGPDAFSYSMRLGHDDSGHVYVAWWEGINDRGTIYFRGSSDAGTTWPTKAIRLDSDGPGKGKEGSRFPWLSADGTGQVYLVWSNDQTGRLKLFLNRSADHGATWLPREIQITR